MANDKRFIGEKPFSEHVSVEEFENDFQNYLNSFETQPRMPLISINNNDDLGMPYQGSIKEKSLAQLQKTLDYIIRNKSIEKDAEIKKINQKYDDEYKEELIFLEKQIEKRKYEIYLEKEYGAEIKYPKQQISVESPVAS